MMLFEGMKSHLIATVFKRPRLSNSFSFNPKNRVFIKSDEVSDFIFVTAVTNRPCNSLIISNAYRVQKLPWEVHDILHRKVAFRMISSSYKPLFEDEMGEMNISSSQQSVSEDEMR